MSIYLSVNLILSITNKEDDWNDAFMRSGKENHRGINSVARRHGELVSGLFFFFWLWQRPAKLRGADQTGHKVTKAQEGQTVYGQFSKQFTDHISHQNIQEVNHLLNNYALKTEWSSQSKTRRSRKRDTAAEPGRNIFLKTLEFFFLFFSYASNCCFSRNTQ